jgi:hypothetical protein
MAMNAREMWVWLAVGVVPYRIERRCLAGGVRTVEVRALFWSVSVRRLRSGRCCWTVRLPLVERLREAVWAAVMRLRDGSAGEL